MWEEFRGSRLSPGSLTRLRHLCGAQTPRGPLSSLGPDSPRSLSGFSDKIDLGGEVGRGTTVTSGRVCPLGSRPEGVQTLVMISTGDERIPDFSVVWTKQGRSGALNPTRFPGPLLLFPGDFYEVPGLPK